MKDLLEREKKSGNETDTPNLLAALARHAKVTAETGEKGLSDDEIIGNTFIFLIAGHETRYISPSPLKLHSIDYV